MKSILVPTDFSDVCNNAIEYAAKLAKAIDYDIVLLHVYHVPVPVSTGVPTVMIAVDELQNRHEERLKKVGEELMRRTGVKVTCKAKMGLAVDEILDEENNSSLIIMGMRSAGKLSETLIGSITTATLKKSNIPVLVIPENVKFKAPEKIVFATDYDPNADPATLDSLENFIKPFGSRIYAVNIRITKGGTSQKNASEAEPDNDEKLYYIHEHEDLVEGINDFVENKKADMIAIIPHKYNFLEGLFHKSISKKMAFHTHVPLLSLPDRKK